MARKGRFTEARIYVASGSVALLLGVWGLLAAQDAHSRSQLADATPTTPAIQTRITSPGRAQSAPQVVQPTPKPHSRTRGS